MTLKHILNPFLTALCLASPAAALELTSADIADGSTVEMPFVFDGWGCEGQNISPELSWSDAPEGTQSFALMVHDPDAPTGGAGFWHWIVLDIPAEVTGLAQNASAEGMPEGTRVIANDYGVEGWGGPCPPQGDDPHRYNVTLYALPEAKLPVPAGASKAVVGFTVNATALAKASFQATYGH
ncbi:YbhB/YbcL family Raf kinase inhibitor-like protein [Pseudooceanicola marinus]|uniref:YbhB/YbcL family Raf kinase inhibitor-like protein n=1 Tax=Pseudooceanicola marinus TaxID=396013 RepID=UPI001CD73123|nr:YbhB/YbcL family Raf kinase inhibitor-like protein [Pseudooceanicola marinus]MCA1334284.1 YbhB/YbcL family Raf kinase inhibitor-like protein [Pseudooceanicola marinus]